MKRTDKPIKFTEYSAKRIKQRGIDRKQVVRTVRRPDREWPEGKHKNRRRLQKRLSPKKLLVVIIDEKETLIEVVTMWFKR